MDFEFSPEQQQFIGNIRSFLAEEAKKPYANEVMSPDREADSMLADSPERRDFNKQLAAKRFLGMSWPVEYGGQAKEGIFEYLVNEELASVGAPLIGKGVGCVGKTLIRHGSEKQKQEFLPQILNADIEFCLGYSEPGAGSDLASLKLKAEKTDGGWKVNGQKIFNTSAHFAEWYWLAARTDFEAAKHKGISLFLIPMNSAGITVREIKTMGDHRTNEVFFDDVLVPEDALVGELNKGWIYICEALDYERFTLYTVGPLQKKFEVFVDMIKQETRDGQPLKNDPHVRKLVAQFATDLETAVMLQRRVIAAAVKGGVPTVEAAMCKLYSTQLGQRLANAALDILGPSSMLHEGVEHAPCHGKWEHSLRATALDTIGGGTSEVQKNIIARRGLELPLVM
ncbi:MAG: acyl-CoA dehydrogenase family protein [Pseudomonadales bacterium]